MTMAVQHPGAERKFNRDVSTSYNFTTTDDYSVTPRTVITGIAGFQIVIQRLLLNITTSAARAQTFRDTGTAVVGGCASGAPVGPITFNFGDDGFVLGDGEDLIQGNGGAGAAGAVTVQAYLRPTPDTDIVANVAGTRGFTF